MMLCALLFAATNADSACLDPKDYALGTYRYPTLEQEIKSSDAIIVGTFARI